MIVLNPIDSLRAMGWMSAPDERQHPVKFAVVGDELQVPALRTLRNGTKGSASWSRNCSASLGIPDGSIQQGDEAESGVAWQFRFAMDSIAASV